MSMFQIRPDNIYQLSVGGVVFRKDRHGVEFAVLERYGSHSYNDKGVDSFSLPAGKIEENETLFETLKREVAEETGCAVEPVAFIGSDEYELYPRPKRTGTGLEKSGNRKTIIYFLARYVNTTGEGMDGEHDKLHWFDAKEARVKLTGDYKRQHYFIDRAVEWLETHDAAE